jgi:hypothetical protein
MHFDWVMGCWRRNNGNFGWRFGKALKMGRDIAPRARQTPAGITQCNF